MEMWTYTLDPSYPDEVLEGYWWELKDIYSWLSNHRRLNKWTYRNNLAIL